MACRDAEPRGRKKGGAMFGRIPNLGLMSLFVFLSMADLALTGELLHSSHGSIYESNPVANWWLNAYGWPGLVGFKLFIVLFIVSLVALISRLRPKTAGRFLGFACAALTVVVIYSGNLLWSHKLGAGPFERERVVENRQEFLDQRLMQMKMRLQVRSNSGSKRNQNID
jgi:hypothetical protein